MIAAILPITAIIFILTSAILVTLAMTANDAFPYGVYMGNKKNK